MERGKVETTCARTQPADFHAPFSSSQVLKEGNIMMEITIHGPTIRPFSRRWIRTLCCFVLALALLSLAWGRAQTVGAEPPWPNPPAGTRTQLPILSFVGTYLFSV